MSSGWIERAIGWAWFTSTRRRLAVVLVLLVIVGTAILCYQPAWRSFRGWRASELVEQSKTHAAREDWDEVYRTSRSSLQIRDSIEALRLFARASRETRDPHRLRTATALFGHPGATTADRVEVIKAFVDANDLVAVAHLVQALDRDDYEEGMPLQVVRFLVKARQFREAQLLADREAAAGRGGSDLVVARGLVATRNPEARMEVTRRLHRVLSGPDREEALQAMRVLASLPDHWIHVDLLRQVVGRFGDDAAVVGSDRLRLAMFRIGLEPGTRDKIIEESISRHREGHLEALLGWLSRLGEAERMADLTDGLTELSLILFQHRANALSALGRYDDLARELENPPAGLSEVTAAAVRASVAGKRGLESEAVLRWNEALELAGKNRSNNEYFVVSAIAGRDGNTERQMESLAAALLHPVGVTPPMSEVKPVLQWLYERGDSDDLIKIIYRLLEREPGNPLLINMFHYLRLLQGERGEKTLSDLVPLVEAFPRELSFRSTLALAQLMNDQPAKALAQFEDHEAEPASYSDAQKAIYAAILRALSRQDDLLGIREEISWDNIPAFEAKVLRQLVVE